MSTRSKHDAARRLMLRSVAAAVALCAAGAVTAQNPPSSPVTINVVDVAGNLALTQDAFEKYREKNPKMVAKFNFTKAPAPELPGKIKAMQGAGRSDIDIVLTGTDFLAAGIDQGLLIPILPQYASKFPNLTANYQPAAAKMQELAQNQGIAVAFMPAPVWNSQSLRPESESSAVSLPSLRPTNTSPPAVAIDPL